MRIIISIIIWSLIAISTFSCTTLNVTNCTFTLSDHSELTIDGHKDVKAGVDTTPEALGSLVGSAIQTAIIH